MTAPRGGKGYLSQHLGELLARDRLRVGLGHGAIQGLHHAFRGMHGGLQGDALPYRRPLLGPDLLLTLPGRCHLSSSEGLSTLARSGQVPVCSSLYLYMHTGL